MMTSLSGGIFTRGQTSTPLSIAAAPTALNQVLVLNGFGTAPTRWRDARRWTLLRTLDTEPALVGATSRTTQQALDIGKSLSADVDAGDGLPQHHARQPAEAGRQGHQVQRGFADAGPHPPDLLLPAWRLRHPSESAGRRSPPC